MPHYTYYCKTCKVHIEQFEISPRDKKDDSLMVCSSCGGTPERVYNVPNIAFKGSGFYVTDHPKKGLIIDG